MQTKQQESSGYTYEPETEVLEYEFLLLPQSEQIKWHQLEAMEMIQRQVEDAVYTRPGCLTKLCETLSLVSTRWRDVVGDYVNAKAAQTNIITPRDLHLLKCRVQSLNLSNVVPLFMGALHEQFGNIPFSPHQAFDWNNTTTMNSMSFWERDEMPLQVVLAYFADQGHELHEVVVAEYARFLVIRSIETLACSRSEEEDYESSLLPWKEACEPSELVKLFWRAHLLFPQKYARDCKMLLDPLMSRKYEIDYIIDYDRRYVSMHEYVGSDYKSKRDLLFGFESELANDTSFHGRFGDEYMPDLTDRLFEDVFKVVQVAEACRKEDEEMYLQEESRV